ncbi:MAG TPA: sigma-70 family RNA polymerase sigma factor [Planctomycetota bacterium]|nr:sigma-70 family RNA polymerase sigma factor [Planctomycetota bacterium]
MALENQRTGEAWLEHATALRSLAAALTSDGSEADDLVQETWLRALRKGDTSDRPRSWWSTVLRNLVRDRARERSRRSHTERQSARPERQPSELELLGQLEIAQRVAAEVARLAEPYRATLHMRYFQGSSLEEIAERSRLPLETIRTRHRRGLTLLRDRMDRASGGDRSAWTQALAAIAFRGKPMALATVGGSLISVGGIALSAKTAVGIATAIVLGVCGYLLLPDREGTPVSIDRAETAAVSEDRAQAPNVQPEANPLPARVVAIGPEPAPPSTTVGEYLETYWGELWPEMKADYEGYCLLTGQPELLSKPLEKLPPPWESAAPRIEQWLFRDDGPTTVDSLVGWRSEPFTKQELEQRFEILPSRDLDASQLAAMDEIAQAHDAVIRLHAGAWVSGLQEATHARWLSGDYERSPILPPMPLNLGPIMSTHTTMRDDWCVIMTFRREDYPLLADTMDALTAAKTARDDEVWRYLKTLQ